MQGLMKVFLLAPRENWIVDRFCSEWKSHNADISTDNPVEADIIWLVADWAYDQVPYELLRNKRVLTSIHHIVPTKFDQRAAAQFAHRHAVTDAYHVPCNLTLNQVTGYESALLLEKKPVHSRPFWVNDNLWVPLLKERARHNLGLDQGTFHVGSFQRDTEGSDLKTAKLEKGPDIFCDAIEALRSDGRGPVPLLGGWRRQYVTNRLAKAGIPFVYNELPDISKIREMYAACDLYVVGSRYEGGPQAVFECAAMGTPIVSTDVGAASEILHPKSIFNPADKQSLLDAVDFAQTDEAMSYAKANVERFYFAPSFAYFRKLLEALV